MLYTQILWTKDCFSLSTVHLRLTQEPVLTCVHAFLIELEFGRVAFCGEDKTREPREKPLKARREPTTNLTHM